VSELALSWLKALHVLAAIVFVGNVIVTGIWAELMFRAREQCDFRIVAKVIVLTDWLFTVGGATLLVSTGIAAAAWRGISIWHTEWVRNAIIGLALSTALWLTILVPAQRRMLRLSGSDDLRLHATYRRWSVAGWVAVVPLLWALWQMVTKPR
jgi:uncharacterized membrane protein